MAGTPANSINISSAGIPVFDGTATFSATTTTQYNTLVGGTSNAIVNVAPGTSGYILTSNGASANPTYQVLPYTAMPWTAETGTSFAAAAGNGYIFTGSSACTATMPASPSEGNIIAFINDSATKQITITGNTGQIIRVGKTASAAAGTCASNFQGDSVTVVYNSSDTTWVAVSSIGTWTVI